LETAFDREQALDGGDGLEEELPLLVQLGRLDEDDPGVGGEVFGEVGP
jgi:hypothetical protein